MDEAERIAAVLAERSDGWKEDATVTVGEVVIGWRAWYYTDDDGAVVPLSLGHTWAEIDGRREGGYRCARTRRVQDLVREYAGVILAKAKGRR